MKNGDTGNVYGILEVMTARCHFNDLDAALTLMGIHASKSITKHDKNYSHRRLLGHIRRNKFGVHMVGA